MVSMKAPSPQPDPALTAQMEQAQSAQQKAVQSSLSADTLQLIRLFGQQNAFSGAGLTMPMTSLIGPKATGAR